jgi:hypothetical protein
MLQVVDFKKILSFSASIMIIVILVLIYKNYNPIDAYYFPKCPFNEITGYKCPGCGSQSTIHYLLNLNIYSAFKENPILVISIPYLLFAFILDLIKEPEKRLLKLRNIFLGQKAILVILLIIIFWGILRNI